MSSNTSTIQIQNLCIQLPAVFAKRADHIARETARCLAGFPLRVDLRSNSLIVPVVTAVSGETDGVIARRLARAIMQQIEDEAQRRGDYAG